MSRPISLSRRALLMRFATAGIASPILTTLLAGCASANKQPIAANPAAAPVAALPDNASGTIAFMVSADPVDEAAYTTLIAAFRDTLPTVAVDLVNMPGTGEMNRRLMMDFASGTPADVFFVNYRRFAAFAVKKTLEILDPYLATSPLIKANDFYAQAIDAFTWQQQLFGIPQHIASLVVYYNKTIFDAAGVAYPHDDWTWDDCIKTAQMLTDDRDKDGAFDVWGLGTDATTLRVAPFIWMNGGDFVDNLQKPTRLTLDTPAARQALAWFIALQNEHHVVPDPVTEKAESHETRFINGRLAMYLESRRITPSLRMNTTFDWDVAPLPRGQTRATVLHSDAFCMAAVSQHKAAAWALIEYASSPAGQTVFTKTGRIVPSLKALATSSVFLDPAAMPAHSQVFLDSLGYLQRLPIMPTWVDIEARINKELELAFHGDSLLDASIDGAQLGTREFFRP